MDDYKLAITQFPNTASNETSAFGAHIYIYITVDVSALLKIEANWMLFFSHTISFCQNKHQIGNEFAEDFEMRVSIYIDIY